MSFARPDRKVTPVRYVNVRLAPGASVTQRHGMTPAVLSFDTPLGQFHLREAGGAITGAGWRRMEGAAATPLLEEGARQVLAYFSREREEFDLPLRVDAGPLTQAVCDLLCAIPFGETRTYGDLAKELGQPAQAVGQACGLNPIPVIIPCHRVLAAKGLGGFSAPGGIETKVALLKLERAAGLLI